MTIVDRVKVIKSEDKRLLNKIKALELKNNDIRSEIVINKSVHQKEIRELTK
jgi:hypothetical protein